MGAHRNSVRVPPRQWPAVGPDLLQRSVSDAGLPSMGQLIKDKRKMSLGVVRRDSTSVSTMLQNYHGCPSTMSRYPDHR